MELLNRYVNAVGARLPEAQRDDIVAELREELLCVIEERSAALRRPLTDAEMVALLKARGHPLIVAASYVSGQHLISPALLPFYRFGAQVLIGVAVLVHFTYVVLALLFGQPPGRVLGTAANSLWIVSMHLLGNVTFGALVLDRIGAGRWLAKAWSPRLLPARRKRPGLPLLVLDVVAVTALAGWVSGIVPVWIWIASPFAAHLQVTSIWRVAGAVLLLIVVAQLGTHVIERQLPRLALACLISKLIQNIALLALVGTLVGTRPWVQAHGLPERVGLAFAGALELALQMGTGVLGGAATLALALNVLRLLRRVRATLRPSFIPTSSGVM